ncbi:hypothetical protein XSR1_790007 [Xenorhabdus szentirmaii DSM 16338]|uniref:Uncharacterized protein n=1 Tax=Xenorhabdus szentirmaii DSM 16338 TaxID=1427518 RepID=W1J7P1_9GAMM|nr:hypothetical protein XSR1_790007 [Xenorhabdus szentirmaii DSM 16338]
MECRLKGLRYLVKYENSRFEKGDITQDEYEELINNHTNSIEDATDTTGCSWRRNGFQATGGFS